MTSEQFKERMQAIFQKPYDTEAAHGEADDLMAQVLRELGYGDGVDIYDKADKWYA